MATAYQSNINCYPIDRSRVVEPQLADYQQGSDTTLDVQQINVNVPLDYEKIKHKLPRTYCCCFKSKKSCLLNILGIILIFLIIIGISGFVLFPKIPTFSFSEPFMKDLDSPEFSGSLNSASFVDPFKILVPLYINVTVNSTNDYDITLDSITFKADFINTDGSVVPNFNITGYAENFTLKHKYSSILIMPIKIGYTLQISINNPEFINEPSIKLLKTACGKTPSTSQNFNLNYSIRFGSKIISWIGVYPTIEDHYKFKCTDEIKKTLSSFGLV